GYLRWSPGLMSSLPTEPGVYADKRGDHWILHDNGRWQHVERRMTDGSGWPVRDYHPISAETLESLSQEPGVEVLPLTRIEHA
ncbi:hypothetical protein, partial [Streptomyces sp. NPDC059071]|uniref:hypothetical protein n=1 Tax=Streptomyces sp. NPDC059071 TaxID=3346714 RepID=UPI0036AB4F3C